MLSLLIWSIWAVSPSMAEATAESVKWLDLMLATSKFPRFFGEPAYENREGPPKVVGVSTGDAIEPLECSSDSGKFSCNVNCDKVDCGHGKAYDLALPAFSAIQGGEFSRSHLLDGLTFTFDSHDSHKGKDGTLFQNFWFTQTMGQPLPIDNTRFQLQLNKKPDGTIWFGKNKYTAYTGWNNWNDAKEEPCSKGHARDTAALYAMNQPQWNALHVPQYTLTYTVQNGRLYLAWRLKFDLTKQVGDDFIVWVNAKNCAEVVAAASASMGNYTRSLDDYIRERNGLLERRGIRLGEPTGV